jgi:hypothetical protein
MTKIERDVLLVGFGTDEDYGLVRSMAVAPDVERDTL